jgi:hypothetical protein
MSEILVTPGFNAGDKRKEKKRPRESDNKSDSGISDGIEITIKSEF